MSERANPTNDPGLVLGDDGIVYEVASDGTRTALGNGGSLPATWTVDAHGNVVIAPDAAAAAGIHRGVVVLEIPDDGGNEDAFRVRNAAGLVTKITASGIVDSARCSFGGYGSDFVGGDPIAGEDQETGNVIFEVKDGGGMNVYEADGTTLMLSVSATGAIDMPLLPTTNPAVAGRLWVDPASDHVVKQSQG